MKWLKDLNKRKWPMNPKAALAVVVFGALAVAFIWTRVSLNRLGSGSATLPDGTSVCLEVADNKITMERGLSGRNSLKKDSGMIFMFPGAAVYSFWMKGMRFPIDIVWLDGETVVAVSADVPPPRDASFPTYMPPSPVNRVLELPAGYAAEHGLKAGDTVSLRIDSNR